MSFAFLFPFLCALLLLAIVARSTVYRVRSRDIDHVILFVRKLDVTDLEILLDAGEEWTLQQSLSPRAFSLAQEDRIRLVREYLHRVAHNVETIQVWVAGQYELIKDKDRAAYTEKDSLVVEALQVALELRIYSLVAGLKLRFWTILRMYRWPALLLPHLPDLRKQCGVDVLAKYRRLTEVASILSLGYGNACHERLLDAL